MVFKMLLDQDGKPTTVTVLGGPVDFQAAAKAAAQRSEFQPAMLNGRTIPSTIVARYVFALAPR